MKVLMINSVCGVGSTGRICTDIADLLTEQGHMCKVAYGRKSDFSEQYKKYAVYMSNEMDVKMHAFKARFFDSVGFESRRITKKFIHWVEEWNPDVIHLHNLHGYYINIEILFEYLKNARKPVVWTLHDCWSFTGHCAHFSFVKCDLWNVHCNHCPQKKGYPTSWLADRSFVNFKRKKDLFTGLSNMQIVTPSYWLKELAEKSYLSQYPIHVIRNGIDLKAFKFSESKFREKYNLINKKIILGVASIWDSKKGFEDFIKLSKKISKDYIIVLIGLSEIQKKDLPGNILGLSRTNSTHELAEIYSAADVFLNLTYEDNYPTVNLEAQACGTPVITYKTGGSIESVPKENVVNQGDLDAICHKIALSNLASLSVNRAENFDCKKYYNEYISLYQRIAYSSMGV